MQLSNAPAKIPLPFANGGSKNVIPEASQIGITPGAASLTDGFPPLTMTPLAAGGVPPSGLDMNGILNAISAIARWMNAGGGFPFDATFSADSNVGGYPQGARVLRSDGTGYWLNTVDNNTTNPESSPVGWVPDMTNGMAAVTMTSANVTLTPAQYGKPIIVLSGALTANLNLIFPNIVEQWLVVNNCTGAYSVTCKTAAGTGVAIAVGQSQQIYGNGTNLYSVSAIPTQWMLTGTADSSYSIPFSASWVDLDSTNLVKTLVIPVGSKLTVRAYGAGSSLYTWNVGLFDGATCLNSLDVEAYSSASSATPFYLEWIITGDGNSHTIALQVQPDGVSATLVIANYAGRVPVMTFRLEPCS